MKGQFLGIVAVLLALPNESAAQLAPPNAAGLAFSHVHLNVADVELLDGMAPSGPLAFGQPDKPYDPTTAP